MSLPLGYYFKRNRRAHRRYRADTSVTLFTSTNRKASFILKDVSERGARLVGTEYFKPGEQVTVNFAAPLFGRGRKKKGIIVWYKEIMSDLGQAGLHFSFDNRITFS